MPVPADPADQFDSAHAKGKHCHGIKPHQVKVVPDHEIAQRKHGSEGSADSKGPCVSPMQVPGHGSPAHSDLQKDHQIHKIAYVLRGNQGDQEVQGTCQIVSIRRPEIIPEPGREGIQQSLSRSQLFMKVRIKRKILMQGINDQYGPVSERPDPDQDKPDSCQNDRNQHSDQKIINTCVSACCLHSNLCSLMLLSRSVPEDNHPLPYSL